MLYQYSCTDAGTREQDVKLTIKGEQLGNLKEKNIPGSFLPDRYLKYDLFLLFSLNTKYYTVNEE